MCYIITLQVKYTSNTFTIPHVSDNIQVSAYVHPCTTQADTHSHSRMDAQVYHMQESESVVVPHVCARDPIPARSDLSIA